MCARLLKHVPEAEQGRFSQAVGRFFDRVVARYGVMLEWVLALSKWGDQGNYRTLKHGISFS
jgi:multidrug efflux pump